METNMWKRFAHVDTSHLLLQSNGVSLWRGQATDRITSLHTFSNSCDVRPQTIQLYISFKFLPRKWT